MTVAIAYLAAITVAEVLTVFLQTSVLGIVAHIAILVATIFHSSMTDDPARRRLILALSLAPLVRVISLSMGLGNIPQIWWYPIIYAPLLAAALVVMRVSGYSLREVGFNLKRLRIQLIVALTGFVFGFAEYLILDILPSEPLITPLMPEFSWQGVWWRGLIFLLTTGFVEEFIFRGVLQRSAGFLGNWWGIIYVSLLFAALHIGFLSWVDVAFVFAVAVFFAWVVKRTGSLVGVTLAHGITNAVLYLVAPFIF
jgi:membrane protease YdiL (CAAX protease family)